MLLKAQTLREPYLHIFSGDDALDSEAEGFVDLFLRAIEVGDTSLIPVRQGMKPATWRLRHLTSDEAAWLRDQLRSAGGGVNQTLRHAVALAVEGVDGAIAPDGKPLRIVRVPDGARRGFTCVSVDQMEDVFGEHNKALTEELGRRVLETLRPRNG